MENYYQYKRTYSSSYNYRDKNDEHLFFEKNQNCIRQQLILFCSTPFFENYKKTNPDLCEHIYNISCFINYGIGNIDDLRKSSNAPFANILKVGTTTINQNLFMFLTNIDNKHIKDDWFSGIWQNDIFKYNDDIFRFLLDTMFQKEDPINQLKKAQNELFRAYTNKLSLITKILCNMRNERVLYVKTKDIDLDTAIQYSNDIVTFTKLNHNKITIHPPSSYNIYKDYINKSLCLTQFLSKKIKNFNFKKIVHNNFNYNKTKASILKTDSLFFYSMMLFLLAPTKFSPLHVFSLKNMFEDKFDFKNNIYPQSINDSMTLISDYYVSINSKNFDKLNSNSKILHNLEKEIQSYFDIDPTKKEQNIELFFQDWTSSFKFVIDNPTAILRSAKLHLNLLEKPNIIHKKAKI